MKKSNVSVVRYHNGCALYQLWYKFMMEKKIVYHKPQRIVAMGYGELALKTNYN